MSRILMVSKPVAPPWNDSSKNLVRDISQHLLRYQPTLMTQRGRAHELGGLASAAVYPATRPRFAPALADNARVFAYLLAGRAHDAWHFFFAPNPRSSVAGRLAARVRGVKTVQTVCSAPLPGADLRRLLFADRSVLLSKHSEALALSAGIDPRRLRRIAPAVAPLEPLAAEAAPELRTQLGLPRERLMIVYPGDLEFSRAAELCVRAHAQLRAGHDVVLVLACRSKTADARLHEQRLRALCGELGTSEDVHFLGETPRIHALLSVADVVALPAETLYAKMDLPLVLIEAMWLARAVLVAEATPAAELADDDAAVAVRAELDPVVRALDALLGSAAQREQLGARARKAAAERFHPAHVAAAYEALYDELLR